jgi:hypothetical protein
MSPKDAKEQPVVSTAEFPCDYVGLETFVGSLTAKIPFLTELLVPVIVRLKDKSGGICPKESAARPAWPRL